MRRSVVVMVVALGVVLTSTAAAQAPTQDSVTGTASTGFGMGTVGFRFDVHSGPSGESPTGTVLINLIFSTIGPLDATCLRVTGNRASMVFPAPDNPTDIRAFVFSVEDNDGGAPDKILGETVTTLPSECPAPNEPILANLGGPVSAGDITVTDAPPLPASKGQCKSGGWRTFGIFKSQGDCVSFVATKGKNPPRGL